MACYRTKIIRPVESRHAHGMNPVDLSALESASANMKTIRHTSHTFNARPIAFLTI